jgi:homoserine trans-succinylase
MMCIGYHSEVQLKEVYANGFESDVEKRISDIASFLKKEYKKLTGNSVTLTKEGEVDVRVENSSRVRSWVMAKLHYKVSGLEEEMNVETGSKAPTAYWQDFLSQGGWTGDGGKRPNNDTRKK